MRTGGLVASRILAIYIAFQAVIFAGELVHDLIDHRGAALVAESAVPVAVTLSLAAVLWFAAPRVARALADGAPREEPDGVSAVEISTIAFALAGVYIAAQAVPLIAHALTRLATTGSEGRDVAADLVSAGVRVLIGAGITVAARPVSRRLFRS